VGEGGSEPASEPAILDSLPSGSTRRFLDLSRWSSDFARPDLERLWLSIEALLATWTRRGDSRANDDEGKHAIEDQFSTHLSVPLSDMISHHAPSVGKASEVFLKNHEAHDTVCRILDMTQAASGPWRTAANPEGASAEYPAYIIVSCCHPSKSTPAHAASVHQTQLDVRLRLCGDESLLRYHQ